MTLLTKQRNGIQIWSIKSLAVTILQQWLSFRLVEMIWILSRHFIVAHNSAESVLNKCIKFSGIKQKEADYRPGKQKPCSQNFRDSDCAPWDNRKSNNRSAPQKIKWIIGSVTIYSEVLNRFPVINNLLIGTNVIIKAFQPLVMKFLPQLFPRYRLTNRQNRFHKRINKKSSRPKFRQ